MNRISMRIIPLVIVLLASLLSAAPARANVRLSFFAIDQGPSPSQLVVRWTTETETNTAGFLIRRGTNADPAQAADIHTEPARGSATTGFEYTHTDSGLTRGQVYYYWLIELEASGGTANLDNGQATAGGGTATPTPTSPPATATPVPTATSALPTATPVPPTATPQQGGAALSAATATPRLLQDAATVTSQPAATATSAPPNSQTAGVTPAAPQATATDAAAAPVVAAELDQAAEAAATMAADLAQRGEGQQTLPQDPAPTLPPVEGESAPTVDESSASPATDATATPQMVAEAPPAPADVPQAQLVRPTATPRPTGSSDGGDNTSSLLMVIGGGSLCGAVLLVLVVFFVWRRR